MYILLICNVLQFKDVCDTVREAVASSKHQLQQQQQQHKQQLRKRTRSSNKEKIRF